MTNQRIKILVVDDSSVARVLLVRILESDPEIQVIGAIGDGQSALDFVAHQMPDVVLMDIHMPVLDGFETTRRMMENHPVPIVICSATTDAREVATSFRIMEAGALACVAKPAGPGHTDFEPSVTNLIQTVKLMSEVKVVRRWARSRQILPIVNQIEDKPASAKMQLVGIGASTGGPPVLQTILAGLPKDFPIPILIVQHIAHGFLPGLMEWLNQTTGWQVQSGIHGALPLKGHAYFAPDDFQMGIASTGRIMLTRQPPENGLRPAVSYLFRSLAEVCSFHSVGVLLTGMGKDGAAELKMMKDRGALTIAQDRETSIVHGMPGEAIQMGGAQLVLPSDKVADALITHFNTHRVESKHEQL
jgi:two-component system, chemotaxis family, protein-glutamate methylesterase/glutaminase